MSFDRIASFSLATNDMPQSALDMGALVGLMGALLAIDGFAGALAITVEADAAEEFWSDLGDVWTIERNYIKPYPICRWAHAALDALSGLIWEHGFAADDVTMIEVNTFAEAAALFPDMPATTSQARYSLPFALAVLLVHGRIGPGDISGAALSDPKVAEVLSRVAVRGDALHSKRLPGGRWSAVSVMLKDDTRLASGDVQARGGPEEPMKMSEVEVKFRVMAAELSGPRATALWEMRELLLQPEAKFSELAALVRASAEEIHA